MKNGQCSKCGSSEVHRALMMSQRPEIRISAFSTASILACVCVSCGYLEEYMDDQKQLKQIAEKWPRVK